MEDKQLKLIRKILKEIDRAFIAAVCFLFCILIVILAAIFNS